MPIPQDFELLSLYLIYLPSAVSTISEVARPLATASRIAKIVALGLPNKSIAIQLHISPWTVATHLRRIFVKLGVTSRTAVITRLLGKNLLHD
jgi:DNA-binding CsgD family transcriptional regulator